MNGGGQAFAPGRTVMSVRAKGAGLRAHKLLAVLTLIVALTLTSCHKSTTSTVTVAMIVSPISASINVDTSMSLFATVQGGATGTVTWDVNGNANGNSTVGTIQVIGGITFNSAGNAITTISYTAPHTVPSGGQVTITATSVDSTTVKSSATVTVLAAAVVTVSPQDISLAAGAQQQFSATVVPAASANVIWEVNGLPGGFQTFGLISNTGLYTAPPAPPPGGSVTITAVSVVDPTQSGSTSVALSFGMSSLQGPYAFTLKGKNGSATFSRAGSFTANGQGGITSGLEDIVGSAGVTSGLSFTGSYTIGSDGRGTLTFNDGLSPSVFRFVMASHNQLQIISFDATGTAAGQADLQNVASFKTSALLGTYLFDFSGLDSSGKPISQVGEFVADGLGNILAGIRDINDNGVISSNVSFTGSYTVSNNGHGTALLGTSNYSFYIVSGGGAKFVSTDASPSSAVAGVLAQQAPGVTFSQNSLNGNYAFLIAGANSAGNIATVGNFSTTGNNILTSGRLDEDSAGTLALNQSFTGTYNVDSSGTGRGTAAFSAGRTYTFVFYLDGQGGAILQETDSAITSDGSLAQQQTSSSVAGSYALNWGGAVAGTTKEFSGQMTLNSSGTLTAGTQDFSTFPGSGQSEALTGSLVSGAPGTLTLNPSTDQRTYLMYVVSPTKMFVLEKDAGALAWGTLIKQF